MNKERPILFSGEMVRAILDGTKRQTRRVLKGSTEFKGPYNPAYLKSHANESGWKNICPYGKIADRMWVKEAVALEDASDFPKAIPDDGRPVRRLEDPEAYETITFARYRATETASILCRHDDCDGGPCTHPWRSPRFMPRWASRITLEITDVRVQRLQDISEADAKAEGVEPGCYECGEIPHHMACLGRNDVYIDSFVRLWESINAKRGFGWDVNPWVWAISFRRVEK